jgi:hypothetical protein
VKKHRLEHGIGWKLSMEKAARGTGVTRPEPGTFRAGPKRFAAKELAEKAGVSTKTAREVIRRLGMKAPLTLEEAQLVLPQLYAIRGTRG